MIKKTYKQKCFSLSLTKNLVTSKKWDGVKDEKFYYGREQKNLIFRKEVHEKPIYKGKLPKKGNVEQFVDLKKRGLVEKMEVVFLRKAGGGGDTPLYTISG